MRRFVPIVGLCLLLIAAAACTSAKSPTWTFPPGHADRPARRGPSPEPAASAAPAAPAAAGGTLEIEAFDLGFTPMDLTVDAPGRYTVKLDQHRRGHPRRHVPGRATTGAAPAARPARSTWTCPRRASRSSAPSPATRPPA